MMRLAKKQNRRAGGSCGPRVSSPVFLCQMAVRMCPGPCVSSAHRFRSLPVPSAPPPPPPPSVRCQHLPLRDHPPHCVSFRRLPPPVTIVAYVFVVTPLCPKYTAFVAGVFSRPPPQRRSRGPPPAPALPPVPRHARRHPRASIYNHLSPAPGIPPRILRWLELYAGSRHDSSRPAPCSGGDQPAMASCIEPGDT
jgi:hypothetical protein